MSRASIRAVDAYCSVCNWDDSLRNAFPNEIEPWARQRDRRPRGLCKALALTTRKEFLRGRWNGTPMEDRIAQWDRMITRVRET